MKIIKIAKQDKLEQVKRLLEEVWNEKKDVEVKKIILDVSSLIK